ncbi:DUF3300 domain-containing protein [Pseudomonas sp. zbq_18]|uniref:DUF3300 domain-containing protein n=1 Tax=Pseudomonas sp. zbq_18 TaxID=3367251 RepID=UPI00370B8DE7
MPAHHRFGSWFLALLILAGCSEEDNAPATSSPANQAAAPSDTASAAPPPTQPGEAVFSTEELDQMLAPLALYPDSLLAQVLMAATYPGNVADAASWSMEHPDASGDEAVRQVADQPWDPSVQSLVAFPAVLATLGQDPAWVQRVGDAFLAQPDAVMDSVQRLRSKAKAAGNLESNEQQKVSMQPAPADSTASAADVQQAPAQTIIIEPADPQVVYVPSYNPSVVYGTWSYPSYPPVYYPPPPGYYVGHALAAGLAFGAGVAIVNSLWGDCDWSDHDIDIDVHRYNDLNINRKLEINQNKWQHNSLNRNGVPYRDRASREQFSRRLDGAQQRDALRGHEPDRLAERERARQALNERGISAPASNNREARERVQEIDRDQARQRLEQRPANGSEARPRLENARRELNNNPQAGQKLQNNAQVRQQVRQARASVPRTRDNAFAGARSPTQAKQQINRGQVSRAAASRPQTARAAGQQVQRAPRAHAGGGMRRR